MDRSIAVGTPSSARIFYFDEPFLTVYRVRFLKRSSPNSTFEIGHLRLMSLAASAVMLYFLCFVMEIIKYFKSSHLELAEIGEVAALGSVYVISFNRAATLLVHYKEVRRLLKNLEKLFPTTREAQKKYKMHNFAQTIIRRNSIMKKLCTFGSIAFFVKPVLKSVIDYYLTGEYIYRYPFITWHPVDDHQIYSYPFVYMLQIFTSLTGVFFLLNEDIIFTTSVTHMCMHYWYLSSSLSQLDARQEWETGQKLKHLIRLQYDLEDLRIDVDEIFSLSTFIGFSIMKASLCMFIFAMFHGIDIINMLPFTLAFLALLIPVYLRCSNGTDLHDASASLIAGLYDQNWYEGTPRHRKIIAMMMVRANKPVLLQASKVNLICLEYFMEFVKQTYQIFMFLHNFSKT